MLFYRIKNIFVRCLVEIMLPEFFFILYSYFYYIISIVIFLHPARIRRSRLLLPYAKASCTSITSMHAEENTPVAVP